MSFCSKLTKSHLKTELARLSLPTNGHNVKPSNNLTDEILMKNLDEIYKEDENYDSIDDDDVEDFREIKDSSKKIRKDNIKSMLGSVSDKKSFDSKNYKLFHSQNTKYDIDMDKDENDEVIIIEDNDSRDSSINEKRCNNAQNNESDSLKLRDDDSSNDKDRNILWIYKINKNVKAIELKELFGKYGKVLSVKIVMNGKSVTGSCFGCIKLNNSTDVEHCLRNLNKTIFRGKIVTVTKNIYDLTHAELMEDNISPVSSKDTWGGGSADDTGKNVSQIKSCQTKLDNIVPQRNNKTHRGAARVLDKGLARSLYDGRENKAGQDQYRQSYRSDNHYGAIYDNYYTDNNDRRRFVHEEDGARHYKSRYYDPVDRDKYVYREADYRGSGKHNWFHHQSTEEYHEERVVRGYDNRRSDGRTCEYRHCSDSRSTYTDFSRDPVSCKRTVSDYHISTSVPKRRREDYLPEKFRLSPRRPEYHHVERGAEWYDCREKRAVCPGGGQYDRGLRQRDHRPAKDGAYNRERAAVAVTDQYHRDSYTNQSEARPRRGYY